MWWYNIIIMIAAYVVSAMLMPKPKTKPTALEDIEFPQFEEGTPQEVFFGDVWTESWMVLGTGNFRTKRIEENGQTIGYKYYMGIFMGLGRGPLDEISEIKVGDKKAWGAPSDPPITANTSVAISKPTLFGGKKREGGMTGTLQSFMGGSTQFATAELSAMLGGSVPGFRGVTTVFYDGGIGNTAYPKPWTFRCRRWASGWYGDVIWYAAKALISIEGGAIKAMNPAHILYECMTNPQWGRGFAAAKMDDAAWRAAADVFHAEGLGLCLRWTRQDSIRNFIQAVLDHVGAAVYTNRTTGLITIKPIRGDYTLAELPLFTFDTGLLAVEDDDNGAQTVGVNEVIVKYRRAADNKTGQVRAHNVAAQRDNGKITKSVEYPGLPTADLAILAAQRDLKAESGFVKRFKLRVDRRAYEATPASVFRFSDPARGINDMAVRVGAIEEADRDGSLLVTVLQDIYGLDLTTYVDGETSTHVEPEIFVPPEVDPTTSITVISASLTAPPGSPADGDMYLVPAGATGAWVGHTGEIAAWQDDEGAWAFTTPTAGTFIYVQDTGTHVQSDGAGGTSAAPWTTAVAVLAWKAPVRAATTAAGTLASSFEAGDVIDGVTLAAGDRILVKDQASGAENGIYVVAASGAPARASDANAGDEMLGATCFVSEGTANGNRQFSCTTNAPIMLGTTALVFAQIAGSGSSPTTTAGDLIVRGAAVDERLPVGSAGQILTVSGGAPAWVSPSASGGGFGGLAYVGSVEVTGAAATTLEMTGLNLDRDGSYFFEIVGDNSSGSNSTMSLFLNADTTPGNYDRQSVAGDGGSFVGTRANAASFAIVNAGKTLTFQGTIRKNFDGGVLMLTHGAYQETTAILCSLAAIQWRTTGVNVTSFKLSSSVANALSVGTQIRVWRYVRAGGGSNIDTEVAADSPAAYWKLNEASGNFADSSGGGRTLTVTGSPVSVYALTGYDPVNTTRKGPVVSGGQTDYASHASTLGLSTPITTFSVEWWGALSTAGDVLGIGASGETSATNFNVLARLTASGLVEVYWEYGSGTDVIVTSPIAGGPMGVFGHWCVTKDAATREVRMYRNGKLIGLSTYTAGEEATGGGSGVFALFGHPGSSVGGADGLMLGAAFYPAALSEARVAAHARALDLFGR